MFPFWHDVVAPLIEAAAATRIVEIGALRGENTELMLQRLGRGVELHVVDPVPSFDPAEHENRFAGQYVFHRDLSVNVLESLAPMDVALIDGDHNWYTVFTELTMLSNVARSAGAPMPLMILHDVAWPYGRRDLYYDPDNIPQEHQQPWRRSGMRRGQEKLTPGGGGMNSNLANAELEGGPRNGVMTAVDDFIVAYDKPLRLVVLPIFFGLAILVEEERLVAQPALAETFAWLESPEGKDRLLGLGEEIRLDSIVFDQAMLKRGTDRVAVLSDRYLDTVKRALVDDDADETTRATLDHLHECLDTVWATYVRGDLATIGADSARSTTFLAAYIEARDDETRPRFRRQLWIADTSKGDDQTSVRLQRLGLDGERIHLARAGLTEALEQIDGHQLALIHLTAGSGAETRAALDQLYPRLFAGGMVVIDDVEDPATAEAVDQFRTRKGIDAPLERTGPRGAHWRKA